MPDNSLEDQKQAHIQRVKDQVALVSNRLSGNVSNILDIGAGVAEHGRAFQDRFGSTLWIVEGHAENNKNKKSTAVKSKFRQSSDDFLYYHDLATLDARIKNLGGKNYHLIDCENLQVIPEDMKFDLITSWKSCGFHYPVNSYADLIKKHIHANSLIVMDIRVIKGQLQLDHGWSIVEQLYKHKDKYVSCIIKFE